jgi:hypothetical protein
MKFRILITMLASVCLAVCGLANAALITHNNYTLNTDTNIVSHTDGTEWLQWDVTLNTSIDSALSSYASQGWMLASNTQMAGLFTDFGWGSSLVDDDNTVSNMAYSHGTEESASDKFIQLFGMTWSGSNQALVSDAIFGNDPDQDGFIKLAHIGSDRCLRFNRDGSCSNFRDDFARYESDFIRYDEVRSSAGIALVRVAVVPEPSASLIFVLGLMGLASRRFKKQA